MGGGERKDAKLPFASPLVHAPTGVELQNPLSCSRNINCTASHATGGHSRVSLIANRTLETGTHCSRESPPSKEGVTQNLPPLTANLAAETEPASTILKFPSQRP